MDKKFFFFSLVVVMAGSLFLAGNSSVPAAEPLPKMFVWTSLRLGSLGHSQRRPRPPKLYRIREVVEDSGKIRQTVHDYTTMGLLPESEWTKGGHRLYDESVFERLDQIAEMKVQGKSLEEIRNYFARRR